MSGDVPVRLIVADDHPVVREGLIAILSTQPDFEVVGAASTGEEAVQLAGTLHPDVVLLDLEMPEMDGAEAIRRIGVSQPDVHALVFTAFDTDERILQAVRAGARGYLLKGAPREEIFNAVRVVHAGGSLLQPVVASRLLRQIAERGRNQAGSELSSRELEVLRLLAKGLQNKEMAVELNISVRTVKFHVSCILAKLGAGNRVEALAVAARQGLVEI